MRKLPKYLRILKEETIEEGNGEKKQKDSFLGYITTMFLQALAERIQETKQWPLTLLFGEWTPLSLNPFAASKPCNFPTFICEKGRESIFPNAFMTLVL